MKKYSLIIFLLILFSACISYENFLQTENIVLPQYEFINIEFNQINSNFGLTRDFIIKSKIKIYDENIRIKGYSIINQNDTKLNENEINQIINENPNFSKWTYSELKNKKIITIHIVPIFEKTKSDYSDYNVFDFNIKKQYGIPTGCNAIRVIIGLRSHLFSYCKVK